MVNIKLSNKTKRRLFWIFFILVSLLIVLIRPFKTVEKKNDESNQTKSYEDSQNKILIITDGALMCDNFEDNEQTYETLLSQNGYMCEEYGDLLLNISSAASLIQTMDKKEYNTYIINLGFGDFINNTEIYDNKINGYSYSSCLQIIIQQIIENNPDAKIIFVTPPTYNNSKECNKKGYTQNEYQQITNKFVQQHSLNTIDLYELTKDNIIDIENTDSLTLPLEYHNFLYNEILKIIQ